MAGGHGYLKAPGDTVHSAFRFDALRIVNEHGDDPHAPLGRVRQNQHEEGARLPPPRRVARSAETWPPYRPTRELDRS